MRIFGKTITTVLLFFFLSTAPSTADIITRKLRSDNQTMILFTEFGFSHTGHVSFEISSMSVTSNSSQPDPSRIGFFLLPRDMHEDFLESKQDSDLCVLDNKFVSVLFTFQDLHESSFNKSYPVSHPGVYSLYFANCNNQSIATMDARIELYNTDGTTKDYLSTGLTQLPSLYTFFSLVYMCFLGFWIFVCFKNRRCFRRIHLLMGMLLFTTLIHLMCAAADEHYLKVTGIHEWDVSFYIFRFFRNALLFTVMWLVSSGWSLEKPSMHGLEKVLLLNVIFLQVWANVFLILVKDTGPYNEHWSYWNMASSGLDLFSCIYIFMPIMCTEEFGPITKTFGVDNAARYKAKLESFGIVVFVYVVFSRIIMGGFLAPIVVYKCPWMIITAEETGSLVLCMVMFYMYRPYDDDEKSARMPLLDEEYGLGTSKSGILSCFCCSRINRFFWNNSF